MQLSVEHVIIFHLDFLNAMRRDNIRHRRNIFLMKSFHHLLKRLIFFGIGVVREIYRKAWGSVSHDWTVPKMIKRHLYVRLFDAMKRTGSIQCNCKRLDRGWESTGLIVHIKGLYLAIVVLDRVHTVSNFGHRSEIVRFVNWLQCINLCTEARNDRSIIHPFIMLFCCRKYRIFCTVVSRFIECIFNDCVELSVQ